MDDSGDRRGDIGTLRGCGISCISHEILVIEVPVVRVLKTLRNRTVQELFQQRKESLWKEEKRNRRQTRECVLTHSSTVITLMPIFLFQVSAKSHDAPRPSPKTTWYLNRILLGSFARSALASWTVFTFLSILLFPSTKLSTKSPNFA